MIPQANQIYKHFKGNLYKVITIAEHTETEEKLVIYQALYGEFKVYARPLSMFMEPVDKEKYPFATQKMRFEPLEQLVDAVSVDGDAFKQKQMMEATSNIEDKSVMEKAEDIEKVKTIEKTEIEEAESEFVLDPMVEAYLDTDSYRERLNILQGLHHRITEDMLTTMSIVIDFELPESDLESKFNALKECLMTKEKYECNRVG